MCFPATRVAGFNHFRDKNMSYNIDPRKVKEVMARANDVIAQGQHFNHGEVIIGLIELAGRAIVEAAQGPTQCQELLRVSKEHLDRTIKVGAEAREKQIITPH